MADALKKQHVVEAAQHTPPGFRMTTEIMTPEFEREIVAVIDSLEMTAYPQPDLGRRYTRAYGWGYDSRTYELVPADPLPVELEPLRHVAAEFAGVGADDLEHCMISRFEPGAMIPWLRMRPIWNHLVGMPLGSAAPMEFRRSPEDAIVRVSAEPRSMYLLTGEARADYEHRFPATPHHRWCLWFRDLSPEGLSTVEKYRRQ